MIKKSIFFIGAFLLATFLAGVSTTKAAVFPYWGPLLSCSGTGCTTCDVFKTMSNILKFMMTLLTLVIVPVMVIVGGIMIMVSGPNEQLLAIGKKTVTGAIVGFLLGAGAFLIISTVIWLVGAKTRGGQGHLSWPEVECSQIPATFK